MTGTAMRARHRRMQAQRSTAMQHFARIDWNAVAESIRRMGDQLNAGMEHFRTAAAPAIRAENEQRMQAFAEHLNRQRHSRTRQDIPQDHLTEAKTR